jgi:hypothetical protein
MEPTTFGFSKFVAWSGTMLFSGLLFTSLYEIIAFHPPKMTDLLLLCVPVILLSGVLFIFVRWCFIPMLQGRITLVLDDEKLQHYLSGTTIYWKDVVEISEDYGRYHSGISFQMVDGRDDLTISTKWIEGSTTSICDKMQEYFARTL